MIHKLFWLLSVCLILCSFLSNAQEAKFTVDVSGNCSPVTAIFTNTSTGFSGSATYQFDLGDGNKINFFPTAPHVYITEKTFNAILIITDNGQVYRDTEQIIVYKKPTVDFTSDVSKACVKTAVNFTSTSTAGDGTITNYLWDFGDGNTDTAANVQNKYSSVKAVIVSLTVTNSYGCYKSVTKSGILTILPAPKVSFSADQTSLCNANDVVTFTNTTTGGALPTTYFWNFNDGTTSSDANPSHSYGVKGQFPARLLATSAEGCFDTSKALLITVASSKSGITLPTLLCLNANLTFTDSSSPLTNTPVWLLDNNVVATNNVHQYSGTFTDTKTHTLQLINNYGACSDTATKIIQAQANPVPSPFTVTIPGYCSLPANATFTDGGAGSTTWEWDFNNTDSTKFKPTAFTKSAPFTYSTENTYYVKLRVTDASGCTGEIRQPVIIKKNKTTITSTQGIYGCKTLATTFKATSTSPISEYNWKFSDNNTVSILDTPQHLFIRLGTHTVFVKIKTLGGCEDTASIKIHMGDEPHFDFSLVTPSDTLICGNKVVKFLVTGDTNTLVGQYYWDFGDNGKYQLTTLPANFIFTHQYLLDSFYTVSIVINNNGCTDTVTKNNLIKVLPSFPDITTTTYNCDDRLKVVFKEDSKEAQKYSWDFGDKTLPYSYDSTNRATEVIHYFPNTGSYKVVLTTSNGGCSSKDSVTTHVYNNQKPVLTAKQALLCSSDSLQTTVSGMANSPFGSGSRNTIKAIEYENNLPFTGTYSISNITPVNPFYANIIGLTPGEQNIRIITNSYYFNCSDTTNYIPVKVNGPIAGFSIADSIICLSSKVLFTDTSKADISSPVTSWQWFFGDSTSETLTAGGSVLHKYTNPGDFKVKLVVTDAENCQDTAYFSSDKFTIKGPKAEFSVAQNPILPNTTDVFTNLTDSGYSIRLNNSYSWSFGDGATSTSSADKITHSYKFYSDDTVTLVAQSSETGCSDTTSTIVHVKNTDLSFDTASFFINPNTTCPPVLTKFTNTSVNFNLVSWDFGDGLTADNINAPSHTYYKPGTYKVTIFGYYEDNTYDSTWNYVTVGGPSAILHADVSVGCGAKQVLFSAEKQNATSLIWDFGDGATSTDSIVSHFYTTPNIYTPSLTVKNGGQCAFSYYLDTPITIDSLNLIIKKDSIMQCHQLLVNFIPKIFSIAKDNGQELGYTWQFGTGIDSSKQDTTSFSYTKSGTYPVTLTATSPYGCTDTATTEVTFTDIPHASIQGPADFCENTPQIFKAVKSNSNDVLTYNWQFQNGTSTLQNPPAQTFTAAWKDSVQLIVDNNGCKDTLYQKLNIHSQPEATIQLSDLIVCLGSAVNFEAKPVTTLPEAVDYVWDFGTGTDSAMQQSTSFTYSNSGTYTVSLKTTSAFGCTSILKDTIVTVSQIPVASINAPTDICVNGTASFIGSSTVASSQYLWHFSDGTTSKQQNSPAKTYSSATTDNVYMVVSIGNCQDTAYHSLTVHDLPLADITSLKSSVCLGDSTQITAHNGRNYQWINANAITNTSVANPYVFPVADTKYSVQVTDSFGCKNIDSITIMVTNPQTISIVSPVNACKGSRANLAASGTDVYNWIDGADLNFTNIAAPVTKDSAQNRTYTVVGSDADGCFADTATIEVIVRDKPVVDAGVNQTLPAGTSAQLSATATGNNVSWNWQPALYLTCKDCASPISKPKESIVYTAEATDNFGCKGSDTVRVTVICKESLVNVPQIFSPNGDGRNDRFGMTAIGVRTIKHFVIYGRSGNKLFERNNISPLDKEAFWDGMNNNSYMPTGTYVYIIQAECDAGEIYNLQGTVTLIR